MEDSTPLQSAPKTNPQKSPISGKSFIEGSQRYSLNVTSIYLALLLPWLFFCLMLACASFAIRHWKPWLCIIILGLGLFPVMLLARSVEPLIINRRTAYSKRNPKWTFYMFVTMLLAWVLAIVQGNLNYDANMGHYFDYFDMREYFAVDPSRMRGQQLMDAGKFHFVSTAMLDLTRSTGLQNVDTYCVAPVTVQHRPLASYDFWAVGLNCCSPHKSDFHCGDHKAVGAHGLRFLGDDQRAFFRLAVQQAQVSHGIQATHPLFFYWVQDGEAELESIKATGVRAFFVSILVHFVFHAFCTTLAVMAFSKNARF